MKYRLIVISFGALTLAVSCSPDPSSDPVLGLDTNVQQAALGGGGLVAGATLLQVLAGQHEFNHEEFGGNGRVCASCHTTAERALRVGSDLGLSGISLLSFVARHATLDLDPEFVELAFQADPTDGLFRSIDSDDGVGTSFQTLREDGLIRIHLCVHPNIHVDPTDAESAANLRPAAPGECDNGATQVITVLRSAPNVTNMSADDACRMWDCRVPGSFGLPTLARQAGGTDGLGGAIGDHFEPGRPGTSTELTVLAAFQAQLHTRPDLFQAAKQGDLSNLTLPPCKPSDPATCRGREFFLDQPALATDMEHRGLCAMCHSGPGLNTTNQFNPVQPPALPLEDGSCPCMINGIPGPGFAIDYITTHQLPDGTCPGATVPTVPREVGGQTLCFHRISNNVVAERNNAGLPEFIFTGLDPVYGPIHFQSPDLGHLLSSGNLCEFPAACFLNPSSEPGFTFQTQSAFRIQSLWGSSQRHRFFHDNSARSLEEVLVHSQDFFHETAVGLAAFGDPNAAAFEISDQDAADMIAYIRAVGL